ncbi:hypothetical protein [Hyalangium versicolor]|uniref:hypothetical protein n=1 Tax=Hyalangium versicolor TaxID=2861190 RepID=UPI001CCBDE0E|nr:hypothetical protein [Hyalangium versicolor]
MRFGAGWLSAGVAALLLTAGCKEGKFVGDQQATASRSAEKAQEQSEKAIDQAKRAQEKATDEQKDAARAQRNLEDAQRDLKEAEAKARTEAQQAQQAQQAAQQQTQQAQQTVAQSQQSALEAQRMQQAELAQQVEPQEGQAQPPAEQTPAQGDQSSQQTQQSVAQAPAGTSQPQGEQFIVGEVLTVNAREVLVSDRGEPRLRLQVRPGTQIYVDGRLARTTDIEEGSQVRASYRDQGGEPTATRIEVTTSVRPAAPVAPESGESSPGDQEPSFQPDSK